MHHNSETWSDAMNTCQNEGALLAVPTTKDEFDEILRFSGKKNLWIGAHDIFSEGVFFAVNGIYCSFLKKILIRSNLKKNSR